MGDGRPQPGVTREDRLSDDGLERLRRQLEERVKPSEMVLQQWVRRYGAAARDVIREAGYEVKDPEETQ